MDDARGPLAAGDDVAVGAEEAQQAQRGGLLHHVESITARDVDCYTRSLSHRHYRVTIHSFIHSFIV